MKRTLFFIVAMISLLSISCQDVITIDLEEGPERLVIEGRIEKNKENPSGYQAIRLSVTADYFLNDVIPSATGAEVTIRDNQGNIFSLNESATEKGLYETNALFAEVGYQYTLSILYKGEIYEASETLMAVSRIDSIYQKFQEKNTFNEEGIRITIDYSDPADEQNYYYWEQYRNGMTQIIPNPGTKWSVISSDDLYNGQTIRGKTPNDELIYLSGDKAEVRQIGLSEFAYRYYFAIFEQEGSRGGLSTPSTAIRGNIKNLTNPDHYPLGYFYASEISEASITVK